MRRRPADASWVTRKRAAMGLRVEDLAYVCRCSAALIRYAEAGRFIHPVFARRIARVLGGTDAERDSLIAPEAMARERLRAEARRKNTKEGRMNMSNTEPKTNLTVTLRGISVTPDGEITAVDTVDENVEAAMVCTFKTEGERDRMEATMIGEYSVPMYASILRAFVEAVGKAKFALALAAFMVDDRARREAAGKESAGTAEKGAAADD